VSFQCFCATIGLNNRGWVGISIVGGLLEIFGGLAFGVGALWVPPSRTWCERCWVLIYAHSHAMSSISMPVCVPLCVMCVCVCLCVCVSRVFHRHLIENNSSVSATRAVNERETRMSVATFSLYPPISLSFHPWLPVSFMHATFSYFFHIFPLFFVCQQHVNDINDSEKAFFCT